MRGSLLEVGLLNEIQIDIFNHYGENSVLLKKAQTQQIKTIMTLKTFYFRHKKRQVNDLPFSIRMSILCSSKQY